MCCLRFDLSGFNKSSTPVTAKRREVVIKDLVKAAGTHGKNTIEQLWDREGLQVL